MPLVEVMRGVQTARPRGCAPRPRRRDRRISGTDPEGRGNARYPITPTTELITLIQASVRAITGTRKPTPIPNTRPAM